MKRFIPFLLCLLVPTLALAEAGGTNVPDRNPAVDRPSLLGTYDGSVFNGGDMDSVHLTLSLNEQNHVTGHYSIQEENGEAQGKLYNFAREGEFTYVAIWQDKYGTGALRILFSSNYQYFYGFWGYTPTETFLPWTGVRHEIAPGPRKQ